MLLVWLSVLTITTCPQGDSERLFLTFTKTHITCKMSVSARETLDFSVIFTATYNPSTKQLYATFTQYIDVDIAGLVFLTTIYLPQNYNDFMFVFISRFDRSFNKIREYVDSE